ncbi:nuclear transport factor 2 family protein [Sphingomonas soli]|uniref:nuclear transport factor 2 family protein n=1 Tax=Sphingomonas soli TaxID=266127 RepID=UPI00082CBF96|nr:nuclear transport factor 2 family protein [Sphingomonas soli]
MRHLLLPLALLAPLPALAQTTTTQRLPPANPLPYEDAEAAAVLAPINAIFAALETGDKAALLAQVYPDGRVTAVGDGKVRQFSFTQFAEGVRPERAFKERIWNPAIEVDGDIAMVWAPYDVHVAGKIANCGIDHFDLIREGGSWKIMNVTFSSRTTGCTAQ